MSQSGYLGQAPTAGSGDFNADTANILRLLARVETATLVRVVTCTNAGGLAPIGTVDVQPLVHQVDGYGRAVPHGTIYGLSYLRMTGGGSAVILDPVAGDLGVAVFASRDTSAVRSNNAAALPGSGRTHDLADGIYLSANLSTAAPTQFIQFNASGITMHAPTVAIQGNLTVTGTTTGQGDAVFGGISSEHHVHGDPQGGVTLPPQ
ncbi:MAG: oxidoreductase [Janthinobacterium lividum]